EAHLSPEGLRGPGRGTAHRGLGPSEQPGGPARWAQRAPRGAGIRPRSGHGAAQGPRGRGPRAAPRRTGLCRRSRVLLGRPGTKDQGTDRGGAVSLGGQGRGWLVLAFLLTLPLVTPRIRGADEIETFAYLRSAVFDRDLDFEDEYRWFHARDPEGLRGFKDTFLDRREPATGRPINFAPLGSALLWSPFYLLAHAGVAASRGLGSAVAADGFSLPYAAAACYASAVYGFLGLLLVHGSLIRFGGFAPGAATAAVAAL